MRVSKITIVLFVLACSTAPLRAQHMEISPKESRPSAPGPAETFTGTVSVTPLFSATDTTRSSGGQVMFEPGARSAWHTHPAGQTLLVIGGAGWVQEWNAPKREMKAGDVIWTPPGVKHWHGATAATSVTHIAIQEHVNGKGVDWMEHVTDAQYGSALAQASTRDDVAGVAPALQRYRDTTLQHDVWNRGGLSRRDRSLVTVAALIARQQTTDMPAEFDRALDNGVKPAELSEAITHLAFYSGWSNAMGAVAVASQVYARRNIAANQLPAASEQLLPLNEAAEQQRARQVDADFGAVAPGVVQYTRDLLFRELWLRPALAPRDRSLITVTALVASGHVEQIPYHLNRAMDAGLTRPEASEALTQLAFYAGWPNVFSALPVAKAVFEKRPAK
jgi:4-carboxymuconolactone decarboxylase